MKSILTTRVQLIYALLRAKCQDFLLQIFDVYF